MSYVLCRIVAPSFVAGFEVSEDGAVYRIAPILRRMTRGMSAGEIVESCRRRGWSVEIVATPG